MHFDQLAIVANATEYLGPLTRNVRLYVTTGGYVITCTCN